MPLETTCSTMSHSTCNSVCSRNMKNQGKIGPVLVGPKGTRNECEIIQIYPKFWKKKVEKSNVANTLSKMKLGEKFLFIIFHVICITALRKYAICHFVKLLDADSITCQV